MLRCNTCGFHLALCKCPDCDARLKDAAQHPNVMFKWCRTCDKHYARCTCETPEFYIISGGKDVPIPEGGFTNALGQRVVPDLKQK